MKLYCDNKAATDIAHNLVQHDRKEHIEIDRHFIDEELNEGMICIPYGRSSEQLVDILSKEFQAKYLMLL